MAECEALCTRIGIMVDGQFKAFGTLQRLKDRCAPLCPHPRSYIRTCTLSLTLTWYMVEFLSKFSQLHKHRLAQLLYTLLSRDYK